MFMGELNMTIFLVIAIGPHIVLTCPFHFHIAADSLFVASTTIQTTIKKPKNNSAHQTVRSNARTARYSLHGPLPTSGRAGLSENAMLPTGTPVKSRIIALI